MFEYTADLFSSLPVTHKHGKDKGQDFINVNKVQHQLRN